MSERDPEVQDDIGQDEPTSRPASEPTTERAASAEGDQGRTRPDQSDGFESQVDAVDHDQ